MYIAYIFFNVRDSLIKNEVLKRSVKMGFKLKLELSNVCICRNENLNKTNKKTHFFHKQKMMNLYFIILQNPYLNINKAIYF